MDEDYTRYIYRKEDDSVLEYLEDAFPEIPARPSSPEDIHKVRLWMKQIDNFQQYTGPITYGIAVRRLQMDKSDEEKQADLDSIPDLVKRQARKETMEKGIEAPIVINSLTFNWWLHLFFHTYRITKHNERQKQ